MGAAAVRRLATVVVCAAAWPVGPAAAEPFVDAYFGKSSLQSSDVRIEQSDLGNSFRFRDVKFDDDSFESPPVYGLRAGYFFEQLPWLGVALDFVHFKIIGDTSEVKPLVGTRNGVAVDTTARVDSIVQQFQVTHGVNYLTVNVLARYGFLEDPVEFPRGRVQLYGGAGVGPVIAHTENRVDGLKNREGYEVAGTGLQVFVGVRALLFKYLGVFVEYRFTRSELTVDLARGKGRVDENTHHIFGGITVPLPSF